MAGKLIVIEGLDGSGKATQSQILTEYFTQQGVTNVHVTFPDYDSPSSTLVKMYLGGELGTVDDVGAYAATSFYAADRYISYKTKWGKAYEDGATIVADRYSTSNIIYQMAKLPKEQWEDFLAWTWDYEFTRLGLPAPNQVIYLDVEPEVSQQLLLQRYKGDSSKKDIHETNYAYLLKCREAAFYAWEKLGWTLISCSRNGDMYSIAEIAKRIQEALAI